MSKDTKDTLWGLVAIVAASGLAMCVMLAPVL